MQRSTSILRPAARTVARRNFAYKPVRRSYATAGPQQPTSSSHAVAGLAGGGVVLLGVYGYYHYSGAATAVNSAKQISATAKDLKEKAVNATPSPKALLGFVRSAALSYSGAFPGASHLVNSTFDQIDEIAEKNAPEVEKVIKRVYSEISSAASKGGDDVSEKIMAAVQQGVSEIQNLSDKFSTSALQPYLSKNPQLKSALNDSLNQFSEFSDKYGPEAKKIAEDTIKQIKELADGGVNGESILKASTLAKQKLKEIQELGAKAGSDAYSKAAEGARPFLDKAPDVKKYLEESVGGLKEYVGDDGVKLINDTYSEIEQAGKKGDTKQLMKIVREKVEQLQKLAKDKGGDIASKASEKIPGLDQIPGADKLFTSIPSLKELNHLRETASEKGGDFEKLLNQTYEEIKSVIEKRGKEAKDLGGEAAKDAKDKVSK